MTDPRALLIRAAEAIPAEYHAKATQEAVLDAALSMACGMLEGLLDPDPVLAGLAARMYRARLAKLETEQFWDIRSGWMVPDGHEMRCDELRAVLARKEENHE